MSTTNLRAPGRWQVSATVWYPGGLAHRATPVTPFKPADDPRPEMKASLGVPHLDDFTKLTVTVVSAHGLDARTMTITRTP